MLINRLQGVLLKSLVSLLSLASFLAIPASAKPKHWYLDKKWWAGTAVIGLSTALDAHSTCALTGRGSETNFILGPHPSCGKVALFELSGFAFNTALHALIWHCAQDDFFEPRPPGQKGSCYGLNQYEGSHSKVISLVVYTSIPAINVASHVSAAIQNYAVPSAASRLPAAVQTGLVANVAKNRPM